MKIIEHIIPLASIVESREINIQKKLTNYRELLQGLLTPIY